MTRLIALSLGWMITLKSRRARSERGLSQSTEVAILLGAAAAVAIVIMLFVKGYVSDRIGEVEHP
ncbi:hypothetical protein [Microlunatus sp. Gsoil 973]|uniref:hypothetical protein n=1 Tax=Microlunatus sp. Gsoil 973 TaxID=2672569 RepID=UPI0012B46F2E|nr:hypothetical protein [Microlunatus sp. Gsoil 973]QGN34569.1 hypothetical protein GJV80_19030 [Microlunatus sp. Gsoil 973]